jgi:hypothetical protein
MGAGTRSVGAGPWTGGAGTWAVGFGASLRGRRILDRLVPGLLTAGGGDEWGNVQ